VALDSSYAIWDAFGNNYWPAVYIADAEGRIRHHHYGEGAYEECEQVIQELLRETGTEGVRNGFVSVADDGFEAQADWSNLETPETYLGSEQARNFARGVPASALRLNQWTLSGDWDVERRATVLNAPDGKIAFRFHARDVHLVMGPSARGASVRFRVSLDDEPPGDAHGLDVDEQGEGSVTQQRLHQLIREPGRITDRTLEISFLDPGVEAYAFTFG